MIAPRPRRSVLYLPATNERAWARVRELRADVLLFDLEDGVDVARKADARSLLAREFSRGGFEPRETIVRVNGLGTPWFEDDIALVAGLPCDGVCLPKVDSPAEVTAAAAALARAGAPDERALWLMIETPRGVLDAAAIAAASPRNRALVAGTSDLSKELRVRPGAGREELAVALQTIVLAARAHGLAALDGVHLAIDDHDGLVRQCGDGRRLGFDGKTLIHPRQIATANRAFAPAEDEIAWAERVVAAHEKARALGQGVAVLEGKLIEALHVDDARRTLALAALCRALDS